MLRKFRLYFTAVIAALISVSVLFTSNVKACEEEPLTFLSLYMNSEIIVTARFESESEPKKSNEDEYGYSLDSERKLVFTKIYKGQSGLTSITLPYSQYVSKQTDATTETDTYQDEHDFDISKITIGGEYLFFLKTNKENGEYYVTDYMSGVKEIDKNLSFYEQNMSELGQIVAAKGNNQYALLTEWIVKSIENPLSREDGIADLSESFYLLKSDDEAFKNKGPFVVQEEYGVYTVGVAKHLTAAQKERVSGVLYPMLQEAWFAAEPRYANFGISVILSGFNKSRLAVYSYNAMQSVGKDDVGRRRMIIDFLTETIGDETFSNISYSLFEIESAIEEAKADTTVQGKKKVRDLTISMNAKLKELDNRYKILLGKNFVVAEG